MDMVIKKLEELQKQKEELEQIIRQQAKRHGRASPEFLEDLEKLEKEERKISRNLKSITKRLEVAEKLLKKIQGEETKMPPLISERVKALLQKI